MKVLVFTSLYPNNVWPNHGVFVKERMTQFARYDGSDIKVIAPVPYFPPININWRWQFSRVARQETRDGVEVYHPRYFLTPKVGMALYGWLVFFSVLPLVQRIRKTFAFDLIDAHYVYPDGFAAIQLGRFFEKPVVVSARGSDVNLYRTLPLIRRLLCYVLRKADRVIAVSQALRAAMIELGTPEHKICHIPNGVDPGKFYPLPSGQSRRTLSLADKRTILSVANLNANKGFDFLIRAFKILVEEPGAEPMQLVIVGEGPFRGELESMITALRLEAHVRLVGAVHHGELRQWYSAADVFCLASEREGWPNVILESLACGTPVVATSVGGIPEIIRSENEGLLTERDEIKLAAALRSALRRRWPAEQLAAYARNYSWEHTAAAVQSVFESVLAAKNRQAPASPVMQMQR